MKNIILGIMDNIIMLKVRETLKGAGNIIMGARPARLQLESWVPGLQDCNLSSQSTAISLEFIRSELLLWRTIL
jgi:hypothetical protein